MKKQRVSSAYHVGLNDPVGKVTGVRYVVEPRPAIVYWAKPAPEPKKRYLP